MRAVVLEELGGPEVLRLTEVAEPVPAPGEVTLDVAYAGVNFADLKARSVGYRVSGFPFTPGLEASGRIRALGEGVTGLRVGQEVTAFMTAGAYAEVVAVPAETVFPVPDGVSLRTAATLPTVLPTVQALLYEVGRFREGETVLVQGAAGGVGTVAGQMARLAGAGRIYGVVSRQEKAEEALKYGYDEVFIGDGFPEELRAATGGRGVDLALDPVGGETLRRTLDSLAVFGRLVSFGNASGEEPWQAGPGELYSGARTVSGFSIINLAAENPRALRPLAERAFRPVAEGAVELPVTAEFPLAEAAEAHRLIETRTTTGKLLLRVAGD
ncbi:quinone oxidoreductase family protein [Streptomyces cucumeris]|uniref:quinone oxidoreductase family protein n=1 Tax=Streptomyces cucumeris TaxID=2962890 RepID=UPI003EC0E968